MTAVYQSQEDLVDLFARSLTLALGNPSVPNSQFLHPSTTTDVPSYASVHYTHSAHTVPLTPEVAHATLLQHSINPSHLFPCQLSLFTSADLGQRLRLLELWRTAPIRSTDMDAIRYRYGELVSTNLLQEEVLARLRLERDVAEQNVVAVTTTQVVHHDAEPYMVSGYEEPVMKQQGMEDQYGAWAAARDFERFQELHRQVEGAGTGAGMDDEMVA